jgi:hypothetical protein
MYILKFISIVCGPYLESKTKKISRLFYLDIFDVPVHNQSSVWLFMLNLSS